VKENARQKDKKTRSSATAKKNSTSVSCAWLSRLANRSCRNAALV